MHLAPNQWVRLLIVLILGAFLTACDGSNAQDYRPVHRTPTAPAPESEANPNTGDTTTVNVVARDFEFLLDTMEARAGSITFLVRNDGSMPHDFAITVDGEEQATSLLNPGESVMLTVDLQAGSYNYRCSVPGHDILGMEGTFIVS